MGTYPPWAAAMGSKCMFGRRRLKAQLPWWPSVLLKYACAVGCAWI